MQLAPLRYTKIEGTAVAVTVTSAAEAKAALKELRHKQRELKFLRGALLRRQRAARPQAQTGKRKPAVSWLRRLFRGLGWAIGALFEMATVPRAERRARDPEEMARELQRIDETLHNIEGCILQLQGKLLTLGSV
jgi:hypothetical protein